MAFVGTSVYLFLCQEFQGTPPIDSRPLDGQTWVRNAIEGRDMSQKRQADGLLAGLTGALVFLAFYLVLGTGLVVSLVVGVASWAAGFLLFSRKSPVVLAQETEVKEAVAEGRGRLAEIRALGKALKKPSVVALVDQVAEMAERVLTEVETNPKELKQARQFLSYYLDSTLKILTLYVDLGSQNLNDEKIQGSLSRVESLLMTLRDAFENQLKRLLSNDVMDLDTEIALLEQTIKMEGLGK